MFEARVSCGSVDFCHLVFDYSGEEAHGGYDEPAGGGGDDGAGVALDSAANRAGAFGGVDGEVARVTNSLGRLPGDDVLLEGGADVAGADDHGADAVAAKLHAEAFGPGAERVFRGAVDGHPGQGHFAGDGTHIDNHATAARAHVGDGELREGEGREEVELEGGAGLIEGQLPGGAVETGAGIVDEDVDGAELSDGSIDEAGAVSGVGEVAGGEEGARGGIEAKGGFIAGGEGEAGSGAREFGGAGGTDALRCSGDEDDLAGNSHREAARGSF